MSIFSALRLGQSNSLPGSGTFSGVIRPLPRNPLEESDPAMIWVEITPYGFISRNYINFVAGILPDLGSSDLPDGSKIYNCKDGSLIISTESGHVVELDKRRRVVLVRVSKAEADGALKMMGRQKISEAFQNTTDKFGRAVLLMPANIVVLNEEESVTVTLPNGTAVFARKQVA